MRKKDLVAAMEESKISELLVSGRNVVDIQLTDALHQIAAVYGLGTRDINDAARASGNGPTEVYGGDAEREVASKEGELAASLYLMGNPWEAVKQWSMGKADSGDLVIWHKNERIIIDVKIRTRPYHRCFKLTLWQWRNHSPDYYVSTQYPTLDPTTRDHEKVRICGYIERAKINALVASETKRILGESLKWAVEGSGAEKRVAMTDAKVRNLIANLKESSRLDKLKDESEVEQRGIGDLGWGPEIIVPFTELDEIGKLKGVLSKI